MPSRSHLARFALVAFLASCSATRTPRPNVLFIAVDDLRPETGCYGSTIAQTPHIDRLAASGVTFTRAYCQHAVCNPSRASLMTGLRPNTIEVFDLYTGFRKAAPDAVTLTQHFMQHGYHAVGVGKIFHNNIQDDASWSVPKLNIDGYPFDPDAVYRGRDSLAWLEQRKLELTRSGKAARHIDPFGKWYLKHVSTECLDVPDDAYFDGAQTTLAIEHLKTLKQRAQPFFFAVGYYRPHLPFNAPKRYWDLYDRDTIPMVDGPTAKIPAGAPPMAINTAMELRSYTDLKGIPRPDQGSLTEADARRLRHGYFASVSYVDAQIGRLLKALEKEGLAQDTIVILWGDHGWKLGEKNSWCKMTNYEIDARVPLIVRAPGAKENGRKCERLVEFVDVYPTLSELAGLPIRKELEGRSFAPLLEDAKQPWKSAVFHQFLRSGKWVAADGVAYMGRAVRTERYRYVEWRTWKTGELAGTELYDLALDPQETRNVVTDQPEIAKDLAETLVAGWKAVR